MMSNLKGKSVLVTGATSGIGKDTALAFAKAGAKVAISGRRAELGEKIVAEITELGAEGLFIQGDVSVESDVKKMVKETVSKFGELNIAFANAGVWGDPKPIVEEQKENIDSVIDINVKGVIYTIKHAASALAQAGGGSIITNSSILGSRPMPGFSVYNASKFAVEGLTRTAAQELAAQKIRVNCVAPGPIETDMLAAASGGDTSGFGKMLPMQRVGKTSEIADTVLWLASDNSSFITGQVIAVDGGYCAG